MLLQMDNVPQPANSNNGKSARADFAMQKIFISTTRTKNVYSDSYPNKEK